MTNGKNTQSTEKFWDWKPFSFFGVLEGMPWHHKRVSHWQVVVQTRESVGRLLGQHPCESDLSVENGLHEESLNLLTFGTTHCWAEIM
jgi:hypothetical protein